jgi:hypothetical protein
VGPISETDGEDAPGLFGGSPGSFEPDLRLFGSAGHEMTNCLDPAEWDVVFSDDEGAVSCRDYRGRFRFKGRGIIQIVWEKGAPAGAELFEAAERGAGGLLSSARSTLRATALEPGASS